MALSAVTKSPRDPARRRTGRFPLGRALAAGTVSALALTGCLGPSGSARVASADASGDGTLRIGLLLDNTGQQNFLNAPQLAAAKLAVKDINAAGGHKGKPVELLPETISTDTAAQAKALVAAKADVVIGPTDSSRAPAAIDVLANAKVAVISPANSAGALSNYKNGGYYFRTSAADTAQASVLAKLAKDGGAKTLAVLHEEGDYGKDVADAVASAAKQSGMDAVADAEFKPGHADQAAAAAESGEPGRRGPGRARRRPGRHRGAEQRRPCRQETRPQRRSSQPVRLRTGRTRPGRRTRNPARRLPLHRLSGGPRRRRSRAEGHDVRRRDVRRRHPGRRRRRSGRGRRRNLHRGVPRRRLGRNHSRRRQPGGQPASQGPSQACTTYKACVDVLRAGKRPDYDGKSGRINFDSRGDITQANYVVYTYGGDNQSTMTGTEVASSSGG